MPSTSYKHQFKPGQKVIYVCYGDDPTYSEVSRPQFLLIKSTIEKVHGNSTFFHRDSHRPLLPKPDRSVIAHFEERTVLDDENAQAQINEIIDRMAEKHALHYQGLSDPTVWRIPKPKEELELYTKVAAQYRSKDYDIKNLF